VFVELSKEAIERLKPIAIATELSANEHDTQLHYAFGSILAPAATLFDVEGIDLDTYMRRFETKTPRVSLTKLRDYQRTGVEWVLRLATWAPGCVLADDMGLGKTVQTAIVLEARAKLGPALVVAPASVVANWLVEVPRFTKLNIRAFDRSTDLEALGPGDVLVVSYGLLQKHGLTRDWSTVVIDEAQYVKNASSQRREAVRALPREFTIALTGTPLENHLGELFSIVDLAFPGLLGDEALFRERFRRPIETHRDTDRLATLGLLIEPFLLRRTRASVLTELPAREEITLHVEPSPQERKRYIALRQVCEKAVNERRAKRSTPGQLRIALLAALTRLRQLACDVRLVDPAYDGPSTKIERVVELSRQLAAEGNHAVVFSQFAQFLDRVATSLEAEGLRVGRLTGKTPTAKRPALIDAFQAGAYDVFCISLLAGGTGLNLTKASYVLHLDPWWNPAAEEQATSRAHRMGQTDPVTVYRLVTRGTIEEAVLAMHADKRNLAAAVLEGKGNPKTITSAELLALLRFEEL
jgi:SNF2 family DNA or RNA helicase